jgi:hypothetical protein
MLASIFIFSAAVLLLLYWCRFTCQLLIQSIPASGDAGSVATAYRLAFPGVQKALEEGPDQAALDALERSLEGDFRILLYLLQHSRGPEIPAVQRKLLVVDYRLMRLWYRLMRRVSAERARKAVLEMSRVLGFFSQKMGERNAQQAVA